MGCSTLKCTSCNKIFDIIEENRIRKDIENLEDITNGYSKYKCTFCGAENQDGEGKSEWRPFTVEEALETAKCLQEARNHKLIIGNVDLKIGEIKKCRKCGKITDVVDYNGIMSYEKNFSTQCDVCYKEDEYDDWFEHCGEDGCKMHDGLNVEKLRAERDDFKVRRNIVKKIFEVAPPKNDGILELNRIIYMFSSMYGKDNIGGAYIWVSDTFLKYCAEHGLLRTNA